MRKNGFTLIELLAVIVILAIIALIATPIILGIINDAREKANERSVELYASAVRNAIAAYQLTGTNAPKTFADLDIQNDGDVLCATEELYEDGSFYIADCTVNGTEVEYTYGTKQVTQIYKPQYYSWSVGVIGEGLPSDANTNLIEVDRKGYTFYVGLDVDSENKVSATYVCFEKNEKEYCLKGADPGAYETNKIVLEDAYKDTANSCSITSNQIYCRDDVYIIGAYTNGSAEVTINNGTYCSLYDFGPYECIEQNLVD